jgi:transcriptional regulator with XRE-family HTH domain
MSKRQSPNRFGTRLRQLRESRGWRLLDLSNELRSRGTSKGVSVQHLSEIERGDPVGPELADALDQLFQQSGALVALRRSDQYPPSEFAHGCSVDLHVFFPARVAGDLPRAELLEAHPGWTVAPYVTIGSDPSERLHLFPFGVAVLHRHVSLGRSPLHQAARRRHEQIAYASTAVQEFLDELNLTSLEVVDDRPYGFSCFILRGGTDPHLTRRSTRALANPGDLWPYHLTDPTDLEEAEIALAETDLLNDDMLTSELEIFDVRGSHYGSASWAAVCVHPLSEASDVEQLLINLEVQLQAFWCYASYVQRHGICVTGFESPFIQASLRKLAVPDPLEHTPQRLLREALLVTSRVADVVEHALGVLRRAS